MDDFHLTTSLHLEQIQTFNFARITNSISSPPLAGNVMRDGSERLIAHGLVLAYLSFELSAAVGTEEKKKRKRKEKH